VRHLCKLDRNVHIESVQQGSAASIKRLGLVYDWLLFHGAAAEDLYTVCRRGSESKKSDGFLNMNRILPY
jgi:hypothetical protein